MSAPVKSPADGAAGVQEAGNAGRPGKVVGIFDLGSNSVRLMLVRVGPVNASCTVLNQVKHMVRLGEGVFLRGHLHEEAMQRTIHVLQGMAGMCSAYGATDIVACATAAAGFSCAACAVGAEDVFASSPKALSQALPTAPVILPMVAPTASIALKIQEK